MLVHKKIVRVAFLTFLIFSSVQARAILTITITEGGEGGTPIAIAPFKWQGKGVLPQELAGIIGADLRRSGRFTPLTREQLPSEPWRDKDVQFKQWRLAKTTALVIGRVKLIKRNRYRVEFHLYDVFRERQLAGFRYTVSAKRLRAVAHQISDVIYQKLTGERGASSSRLAYISYEISKVENWVYTL